MGRLHPHARRADLPDRQPVLRLEVRVGARAAHERAPGLPRPRQGARRLEQHQRDDLPARQPDGLRALGGRPGHGGRGTTRTACRTSSRWRPAWPAPTKCRGHDGPLVLERGPATSPLFQAFFQAVQQAGYPLTDDVNGYRQEGFAPFDRNVHRGRRLSAARAYLHPVMGRPNLDVETRAFVTRVLFDGRRAIGVEYRTPTGGTRRALGGEVILCGGAINTPQLLQLSGVGNADELKSFGIDAVARPAGRRREHAGPPRGVHPVRLQAAGLRPAVAEMARPAVDRRQLAVPPQRPGRHQPLRGRRLRAQQRRCGLPQPDVPLPADRDPLRRLGRRPAATAIRSTSARCTPTRAAR